MYKINIKYGFICNSWGTKSITFKVYKESLPHFTVSYLISVLKNIHDFTTDTCSLTKCMKTLHDTWRMKLKCVLWLAIQFSFSCFSIPFFQSFFGLDFIDWSSELVLATIMCFTAQHNYIWERESKRGKEVNKKRKTDFRDAKECLIKARIGVRIKVSEWMLMCIRETSIFSVRKRFYTIIIFTLMFVRFKYCYKRV